jgi:hypothetical protein
MALDYAESEFTNAWGAPAAAAAADAAASSPAATLENAVAKERAIKEILQLRDGLRGLLVRVTEVEKQTDKLRKDNEFLGTYIDNL